MLLKWAWNFNKQLKQAKQTKQLSACEKDEIIVAG